MSFQAEALVIGVPPAQPQFLSDRCGPQVTVVDLCDTPFSRPAALFPPSIQPVVRAVEQDSRHQTCNFAPPIVHSSSQ